MIVRGCLALLSGDRTLGTIDVTESEQYAQTMNGRTLRSLGTTTWDRLARDLVKTPRGIAQSVGKLRVSAVFLRFDVLLAAFVVAIAIVFAPSLYDDFTLPKQMLLLLWAGVSLVLLTFQPGRILPADRTIKLAFLALIAVTTISFLLSKDIRGSLLGYYQYRQGYLSQVAALVLFLAGIHLARKYSLNPLLWSGLAGLAAVCGYAALQKTGNDPFRWWLDVTDRPFGTIGNSNELAAYLVIAFAFGGVLADLAGRWRAIGLTCLAATLTFTMLLSESRSGLLAALAIAVAFPIASAIVGIPRRSVITSAAIMLVGVVLGVGLSLPLGAPEGTAARIESGILDSDRSVAAGAADSSVSTRLALAHGTVLAVAEAPLFGHGPDSLYLAFSESRPPGLGGIYQVEDLVVQSSHNWLLDVAANQGLLGLGSLLLFLGLVAQRSLRHEWKRGALEVPYIWSALVAYMCMAVLNQVSVGPHAIFFLLLGVIVGRTETGAAVQARSRALTRSLVYPLRLTSFLALGGLAVLATLALWADLEADRAWAAMVNHRFAESAEHYTRAGQLNLFERVYRQGEASAWAAAGACRSDAAMVRRAERTLTAYTSRFTPSDEDLLNLAKVRIALGEPPERVEPLLAEAKRRNPEGIVIDFLVERYREALYGAPYRLVYIDDENARGTFLLPYEEAITLTPLSECVIPIRPL